MVKNVITFLFVLLLMGSCIVSGKLSNKYIGKGVELLYSEMGEPKKIVNNENGNRLFIYEKETFVKETIIGTGRGTLDPRISPSFVKVEVNSFEIDNKGIVVGSKYEKRTE